ncbi:PRK06851 family protein [Aquibacillus albus]|uniref:Cdc6-like AAA superfamily ATPase n=1 Tax=Aquibacillus albus TaxID=1168171 RepID=A0ABS2MYL3_9BACI|nr:PRK06851 family protein [Aquibacillus albus]MBM7570765.1 Cdc6-like AAA superfamily ATPase [Aquibacillus albus]
MVGKVTNYFAGGNTAKGFYDLFDSNVQGLESVYILKGGPGTGKSSLIKKLANEWLDKGYDIELIHCSADNDSVDGLIIPVLKFGIFDGTAPHVIEPHAPGAIEQYVNLGVAWDTALLKEHKSDIVAIQKQMSGAFDTAYDLFQEGLRIHDKLEEIYIKEMDFAKANQVTNDLLDKIFLGIETNGTTGVTRHRFFGASTPEGVVDFIPNITEDLTKRYFIKGRAGTGKSTLLKKIARAAEDRGFDVEMYHCGFDPDSMDMVVVRELGVCVFDSTDPHEYFPERHGDEIVDLYEKAVNPGTDEKYEEEIADFTKRYKQRMKEGITYLQEAKALHDQLEKIYIEATDFSVVDGIFEEIHSNVLKLDEEEIE